MVKINSRQNWLELKFLLNFGEIRKIFVQSLYWAGLSEQNGNFLYGRTVKTVFHGNLTRINEASIL